MKHFIVIVCCLLGACFNPGVEATREVTRRPPSTWSIQDCYTVVRQAMQTNYFDRNIPNIKVAATPYTPWVVMAVNRMSQLRQHWSTLKFEQQLDTTLPIMSGLYYDPNVTLLFDSRGNFLRDPDQLDSLMFLITLRNSSWPCQAPAIAHSIVTNPGDRGTIVNTSVPAGTPSNSPCYIPDIVDLPQRIFLRNGSGLIATPKYVWGRHHEQLTTEETLLVMFPLHVAGQNLLTNAKALVLVIDGFDTPINLAFHLDELLPAPAIPQVQQQ